MDETRRKTYTLFGLLVAILVIALIFSLLPIIVRKLKSQAPLIMCQSNLRKLWIAMQKYADDYDGQYPTPSEWCDLLIERMGINKSQFFCTEADDGTRSTYSPIDETKIPAKVISLKDYNDSTGQKKYVYKIEWSHYGLNPNAKPNSPLM